MGRFWVVFGPGLQATGLSRRPGTTPTPRGHVVDDAQHTDREIDNRGPILGEIEEAQRVHGRGVPCQEHPHGIDQAIEDADLIQLFAAAFA